MFFKNKSVVAILVLSLVTISIVAFWAINDNLRNKKVFENDGYFLIEKFNEETNESSVEQVAFKAGESYKYKYPAKIVFKDTENKNVSVDRDSFIHFSDGSVASSINGVLMDLDGGGNDIINYYNVSSNTNITKNGSSYSIDHMGNPIKFTDFIWKLNDNKYILVGDTIELNNASSDKRSFEDFVEVSYVENGIVKVISQNEVILTVSSDSIFTVNDTKVDFSSGQIKLKDNVNISMAKMSVDADDNIQLTPLSAQEKENFKLPKFKVEDGEDGTEGEIGVTGEQGNDGIIGQAGQNGDAGEIGLEGNIGGSGDEGSEGGSGSSGGSGMRGSDGNTVDPNTPEETEAKSKVIPPEITLSNWLVTPIAVSGELTKVDEEVRLINDSLTITVNDIITGKQVTSSDIDSDLIVIPFQFDGLDINRTYQFLVKGRYRVDGIEYEKIFIDKIFRTDEIGLTLSTETIASDSFKLKVIKDSNSSVERGTISIFESDGSTAIATMTLGMGSREIYVFDGSNVSGLAPNTEYVAKLTNLVVTSGTQTRDFDVYGSGIKFKTLKTPPVGLDSPNVMVDKRSSSFIMSPSAEIIDVDFGISSYRYDIYSISDNTKVTTISKPDPSNAVFSFANIKALNRGVDYYAKLVLEFNDNEKIVEYESEATVPFQLSSAGYPSIRVEEVEAGFNYFKAKVYIERNSTNIVINDTNPLKLKFTNSVGSTIVNEYTDLTLLLDGTYMLEVNENNLRQSDSYLLEADVYADLIDGNGFGRRTAGSYMFNTTNSTPMMAVFTTESAASAINATFYLQSSDEREKSYLDKLVFELYSGSDPSPERLVSRRTVVNTNIADPGNSSLLPYFSQENRITINEAFFGKSANELDQSTYSIKVTQAINQTRHLLPNKVSEYYENEFQVESGLIKLTKNEGPPEYPLNKADALRVVAITRKNADSYGLDYTKYEANNKSLLNSLGMDTVIGYYVEPTYGADPVNLAKVFNVSMVKLPSYDTPNASILSDAAASAKASDTIETFNLEVDPIKKKVPTMIVLFGDGEDYVNTSGSKVFFRTTAARGNQYFFSYRADLVYQGVNVDYPSDPSVLLYSTRQDAPKEKAVFSFYPSQPYQTDGMIWKYVLKDVDSGIVDNKISYKVNSTTYDILGLVKGSASYNSITLSNLIDNTDYTASYVENLYTPSYNKNTTVSLFKSKFTKDKALNTNAKFDVLRDNIAETGASTRFYFTIRNLTDAESKLISGLKVTVSEATAGTLSFNLPYEKRSVNNETIYVSELPYSVLGSAFQFKDVSIKIDAYYDSGISGLESLGVNDLGAIQIYDDDAGATDISKYIALKSNQLVNSDSAGGSLYNKVTHDSAQKKLIFKSILDDNFNGSIDLTYNQKGSLGSSKYITLKKLNTKALYYNDGTNSLTRTERINAITPEVQINTSSAIISEVTGVIVGPVKLTGTSVIEPVNGSSKVFIELYNDQKVTVRSNAASIETTGLNELEGSFTIGGLNTNTYYYFRFYVMIDGSKYYLLDKTTQKADYYRFLTKTSVGISDFQIAYNPTDYLTKVFNMYFSLDSVGGYRLYYDFEKVDETDESKKYLKHEAIQGFSSAPVIKSMVQPVPANLGSWFEYGKNYKVKITTSNNNINREDPSGIIGTAEFGFYLPALREPTFSATATAVKKADPEGYGLLVKTAPIDSDKVIVNGKYLIKIFNGDTDITPSIYNQPYIVSNSIRSFEFDGLEVSHYYTIRYYAVTNTANVQGVNDIEWISQNNPSELSNHIVKEITAKTLSQYNTGVGNIEVKKTPDNKFKLVITDSYNIELLNNLTYSYIVSGVSSTAKTIPFTPVHVTGSGTDYYEFILPDTISTSGTYNIQLIFMINTTVVDSQQVYYTN